MQPVQPWRLQAAAVAVDAVMAELRNQLQHWACLRAVPLPSWAMPVAVRQAELLGPQVPALLNPCMLLAAAQKLAARRRLCRLAAHPRLEAALKSPTQLTGQQ